MVSSVTRLQKAMSLLNKGGAMSPILVHYSLTLDLAGRSDINGTVNQFLEQAGLSKVKKSVEMMDSRCIIRFIIEGPETLVELREVVKSIAKGLFSEATKTAIKRLKERPSDLYLELTARPPLFGREEDGSYSPA
jgi:hypothetical protein